MKNILYIHQYFKTPSEGGALRSYHIAKGMADRGLHVDMVTGYNGKSYKEEQIEGFTVYYLPVSYSNQLSFFSRSISFLRFFLSSIRIFSRLTRPDLVYATSTPLTVGLTALWIKWTKKIPYIFEVRDLWPEAPIQLGIIKNPMLKYLLRALERKIYQHAERIIALSPGIKQGILNVNKNTEVAMIPNMSDIDYFGVQPKENREGKTFKIGYFGAFGMANNIAFVLELARVCQQHNLGVNFVLAGEGSEIVLAETEIKGHDLNNVRLLGHVDRLKIKNLMSDVDACVTSFLNIPVLQTNSPNKFFDGLASAKLMIVNTKGWLEALVIEHQCGFYVDPKKPEEFLTLLSPYLDDLELLHSAQKNAFNLAKNQFSKQVLVEKVCKLVINTSLEN